MKGAGRCLGRTVNANERVEVERDHGQRIEPGLEAQGEHDVKQDRELRQDLRQ